jgi:hypothetical protein
MFLKFFKNFSAKRTLKKSSLNVKGNPSAEPIKTVGLLIDKTYFEDKVNLIEELLANGIKREDIQILLYKDRFKKKEIVNYPSFSHKDLSWKGTLENENVKNFTNKEFDMLISYYDTEKAPLMITTFKSKANFKVGFSTIDKRLNHFMINTNAENYKVFVSELFKYLKILNKI